MDYSLKHLTTITDHPKLLFDGDQEEAVYSKYLFTVENIKVEVYGNLLIKNELDWLEDKIHKKEFKKLIQQINIHETTFFKKHYQDKLDLDCFVYLHHENSYDYLIVISFGEKNYGRFLFYQLGIFKMI